MLTPTQKPAPLKTPQQVLDYLHDYEDDSFSDVIYALLEHFYISQDVIQKAIGFYISNETIYKD